MKIKPSMRVSLYETESGEVTSDLLIQSHPDNTTHWTELKIVNNDFGRRSEGPSICFDNKNLDTVILALQKYKEALS